METAYDTYRQLVARVEAFGQAIRQRYPGQITCQAGCDGCCYQQFTIFPVEAYHLARAVKALSTQERQRLQQHLQQRSAWQFAEEPQPCVLLEHGRCRLYAGRPLICRLHGYPLYSSMIERPDGLQRDCCPLNFTRVPLPDIAPQAIYNLDLVNHTLAAIQMRFGQEMAVPEQRVTIRHAVSQALEFFHEAEGGDGWNADVERGSQG
jgi:Fe-S-cluster containining protein